MVSLKSFQSLLPCNAFFSDCFQDFFFFFSGFQQFDYTISGHAFLLSLSFLRLTEFVGFVSLSFVKFGELSVIFFFKYFFLYHTPSSLFRTPASQMLGLLILSHRILRLCFISLSLFSVVQNE